MKLYHLTAIPPTAVNHITQGSFTAPRQQELITATTSTLHLYRLQPKQSQLQALFRLDTFSLITQLSTFRLPGTRRDHIILLTDSGNLTVLQADISSRTFIRLHCEPFGRTGIRRCVPSLYLSVEPHGRACMISAVERQKFCYVLNRDGENRVTISSPLSCHRSNVVTYSTVAIDVGFENPMFAALERTYSSEAQKMLVYYELDLGLNTLVRKMQSPVRDSSFVMLMVPGGDDGPGGVLVCSEDYVTYRNLLEEDDSGNLIKSKNPCQLETRLPHREFMPSGTMIVSGTMYHDRKGNAFFFLLCTEHGDLIKADLQWTAESGVTSLKLAYFDSVPMPAIGFCIFRSGYLFLALEGSDSFLLQFRTVDVPKDSPGQSVAQINSANQMDVDTEGMKGKDDVQGTGNLEFKRKPRLEFLLLVASIESFAPLLSHSAVSLQSGETALVCTTGRRSGGSVRLVRRGIGVLQMSEPLNMGSRIRNVFACKKNAESLHHSLIVVAFDKRTKVLAVGETKVEETANSGFELHHTTLCAVQIGASSFVQVYRQGVRYIPSGRVEDAKEWKPPVPSRITAACCNGAQVIVCLSSGTIVYFEVDVANDLLLEVEKMTGALQPTGEYEDITHGVAEENTLPVVAIADISQGLAKASIFAVADKASTKVRLYQVQTNGKVQALGLHVAPAVVESLALTDFGYIETLFGSNGRKFEAVKCVSDPMLTLIIGTKHGAMVRLRIDSITGAMSGKRSTFLGPDPVNVHVARLAGVPTCLVMGSRSWILFRQGSRLIMSQMCTSAFEKAAAFSSEQSPDGFIAATDSKLHLLCIDILHAITSSSELPSKTPMPCVPVPTILGSTFQLSRTRTPGTPRKLIPIDNVPRAKRKSHLANGNYKREVHQCLFGVIEADHRANRSVPLSKQVPNTDLIPDCNTEPAKDEVGFLKSSAPGLWVSQMRIARLFEENEDPSLDGQDEEDDEFDSTNLLQDDGLPACKDIEIIRSQEQHESVLCLCSSKSLGGNLATEQTLCYLVASVAKNLTPSGTSRRQGNVLRRPQEPERPPTGALRVYRIERKSSRPILLHETPIEEPAFALAAFRDMIVVGIGRSIRLYDLGKQRLLRKGEYKYAVRNRVAAIAVSGGDRIFVGDVQDSVTLYKYIAGWELGRGVDYDRAGVERRGGRFICIAKDTLCRWVVALVALDYSTVCGSDKFGNIFVLRLPQELASMGDELMGVATIENEAGIGGSHKGAHQLHLQACVHVGAMVISLTLGHLNGRTTLEMALEDKEENEQEAVIYATMDGAVGVLAPLATWNEAEFARLVEHEMRRRYSTVCGRDHLAYRSAFYALKNVVDGDLCEMLGFLPHEDIIKCCSSIGQSVSDVMTRIDELRETWIG